MRPGLLAVMALSSVARADPADTVIRCLEISDLACAQAAEPSLGSGVNDLVARAQLEFSLGEFAPALEHLRAAAPSLADDEGFAQTLGVYERTEAATADFATVQRGDVTLRYRPGMDEVLVDEALETLQAAHDRIGPLLGGAPPGGVRVELYPTAQRFIDASSLPGSAVRTTGVIALSKWTRLLVSSPRALGHGYAWKDTIAHEYIHYIVAWRTLDKAPVWLQEGIARSHEALWAESDTPALQPLAQSLLAEALANNTLVPLQRMHPSMAFLDSQEEAALAFAQVSTMIVYLRQTAGSDSVSRVLDLVREGRDALQAVADVGADGDSAAFMSGWKDYLRSLKLVSKKLASARLVLDGAGDEVDSDPVLGSRADLAQFVRLGDILYDHQRADAALVEYRKAVPPDEPASPVLTAHTAEALTTLGRKGEAMALLKANILDYPESAATRRAYAKLLQAEGRPVEALAQYRAAADLDPFDPDTQSALSDLYGSRGEKTLSERHARYGRILRSTEPLPDSPRSR